MVESLDSLDIAKRVCQHIGCPPIQSINEDSRQQREISVAYGPRRVWELRRNVWTFATRKVMLRALSTTTLFLAPKPWNALVTYLPGSVVADENGDLWVSYLPGNINNEPGVSFVWDKYFGPMTVQLYDTDQVYHAGELVYAPAGDPGGYVAFVSLQNDNSDDPETATAWDTTATYNADDTVTYLSVQYRSLIELNTGITPVEAPLPFAIGTTYSIGQTVAGTDGYKYTSVGNGNVGHDPVTDAGVHWTNTHIPAAWTALPTLFPSSTKWLPLFAALESQQIIYPLGAGPIEQGTSRNVFRLPAGYLREAPQNPKQGIFQYLGGPNGNYPKDWEHNGKYIVTNDTGPIVYRFVADVTNVGEFDPMFCETLAASVALVVCEPITQSSSKLKTIASEYSQFESDAIEVNAIEQGAEEPDEDDFLTVRN